MCVCVCVRVRERGTNLRGVVFLVVHEEGESGLLLFCC